MNHREPTSAPPRGVGRALPCLAAVLLPLLAADRAWSRPATRVERTLAAPNAYLPSIGAPSMRFLAPTPPPDLVTRPPAAAPPQPAAADVHVDADSARHDFTPPESPIATVPMQDPDPVGEPNVVSTEQPIAPERAPAPILVDELRPRVRAEDFLPYFQIPAEHSGDASVLVPIPRGTVPPSPLPTSSATYTQSPR